MTGRDEKPSCCSPGRMAGEPAGPGSGSAGPGLENAGPGPGTAGPGLGSAGPVPGRTGPAPRPGRHDVEQRYVPAGTFAMGDASGDGIPADGEGPVHDVELGGFGIDAVPVTNAQFARFVAATGYRTDAERFGSSAVFHLLVAAPEEDVLGRVAAAPWWITVRGADWRRPGGRHSTARDLAEHPAVHVSWNDAAAYCRWAGRRLPTEAEWERASRGGLESATFPWGSEPLDGSDRVDPARGRGPGTDAARVADPGAGRRAAPDADVVREAAPDTGAGWRANVWQGEFPVHNTAADGWVGTAPVRSYAPNGLGLWQTVGNVWEWCADWFDPGYYARSPRRDPGGPAGGVERVLRGGSYLCHPSYCNRYRNSARSRNTPESSMGNAGFRTVAL